MIFGIRDRKVSSTNAWVEESSVILGGKEVEEMDEMDEVEEAKDEVELLTAAGVLVKLKDANGYKSH